MHASLVLGELIKNKYEMASRWIWLTAGAAETIMDCFHSAMSRELPNTQHALYFITFIISEIFWGYDG